MAKILKFDSYRQKDSDNETITNHEIKKGCLMLFFAFSNWSEFIRKLIDENDIYLSNDEEDTNDYGYSDDAHCTILFGFHHYDGITEKIKKYLPELEDIDDVNRGDITLFEQEEYDVVKFDITSEKLKNLNEILCENFEYSNDYPDFHPHMTIAYVKKGQGAKYVKQGLKQVPLFGDKYVYSDPEYNKIELEP